jgi:iron(III) transport system substrate-binding protein
MRDAAHRWTGFAARARVIAFDPARVAPDAVPATIEGLLDPSLRGEVAIADPRFGTTGSHLAALLALWGEERYRRFLAELRANGAQVVAGNSASRDRVLSGEARFGLTDTDDVEVARRAGDSIREGFFPAEGTVVLPNTVAIVAGAPHPEPARALVEWLLAPEIEAQLAASPSRQIPVRSDVPVPETGLRLAEVRRVPVSLEKAAEMLPRAIEIAVEEMGM